MNTLAVYLMAIRICLLAALSAAVCGCDRNPSAPAVVRADDAFRRLLENTLAVDIPSDVDSVRLWGCGDANTFFLAARYETLSPQSSKSNGPQWSAVSRDDCSFGTDGAYLAPAWWDPSKRTGGMFRLDAAPPLDRGTMRISPDSDGRKSVYVEIATDPAHLPMPLKDALYSHEYGDRTWMPSQGKAFTIVVRMR